MRNLLFEDDWFSINHSIKAEELPVIVVCSVTVLVTLTIDSSTPSTT